MQRGGARRRSWVLRERRRTALSTGPGRQGPHRALK
jgi:hypothetical protein